VGHNVTGRADWRKSNKFGEEETISIIEDKGKEVKATHYRPDRP
jgi:hypothetical protein